MKEATSYPVYHVECPHCGEDFELGEEAPCETYCEHCGKEINVTE